MTVKAVLFEKRPYFPILIFLILLSLMTLPLGGVWLIEPDVAAVGLTLARLAWHLTPLPLWLAAILIVAVWLLALRRYWTNGA